MGEGTHQESDEGEAMSLRDTLGECIKGNDADAMRRKQMLATLLDAFERGGAEAASEFLERQMKDLATRFDAQLTTVEKNT